jgi:glucose-6-phosphate dehydrogenase assembly protein OpcA
MSAALSPEHILRELADLWVSMAKDATSETGDGVLRACSATLIVLSEVSEDATALDETIAALMSEHPARTVVIRLSGAGERALSERVYAECWMPFGQRRQICCEQIEITASDAALADLPSVVLPLAVADLPVILWCRTPRLLGMPEFRAIAAMATRVIVDSAPMPDAPAALRRLASAADRTILGDLAWTRLTRWREMLSQVFQNRALLAQIGSINEAQVRFGPGYETSARYLAAWISGCLPQVKAAVAADPNTPTLQFTLSGEAIHISLHRQDGRLVATVNEISQCTNLPQPGDYILMREELSITARDAVFERTLSSVARVLNPSS